MTWFWHGAYVLGVSQIKLAGLIGQSIINLSDGKICLSPDNQKSCGDALVSQAEIFICVAPQVNNWTAFWTSGSKLTSELFVLNKFSGISINGWDEFPFDDDIQIENVWEIQLWDKGQLVNWFVSDPEYYFEDWGKSLETFLLPYILSKTGEPIGINRKEILNFIKTNKDFFNNGFAQELAKYAFPDLNLQTIENFLSLPTISGLIKTKEILNIPYVGCEYHLIDIAIYFDLISGLLKAPQDLCYLDIDVENRYKRPLEWQNNVKEFLPILFKFADGEDYYSVVLSDYPNIFFWL